jgi:hypothetical protein
VLDIWPGKKVPRTAPYKGIHRSDRPDLTDNP